MKSKNVFIRIMSAWVTLDSLLDSVILLLAEVAANDNKLDPEEVPVSTHYTDFPAK